MDPDGVARLIRRAYRADARILLALGRWVGRPVFDLWVAEEEGRLVGSALVTYSARAGTLSSVAVAPARRREGWARALLAEAHRGIRAARRSYALLEVIRGNGPARRLYDGLGYRPYRSSEVRLRDGAAPVPDGPPPAGVRPFQPADGPALARLLDAQAPEEVRRAAPATPGQFQVPAHLLRAVGAATAAWVLDGPAGPSGFVRATVGGLTRTAHLTQPLLDEAVDPAAADGLLRTALGWIGRRGRIPVVVQVPLELPRAGAAVAALGFRPAYTVDLLGRECAG